MPYVELEIRTTPTSDASSLTVPGKYGLNSIIAIDLLEWKITGLTNDPSSTAYTDDVIVCELDDGNKVSTGYVAKNYNAHSSTFSICVPTLQQLDSAGTITNTNILQYEFKVPRRIADYSSSSPGLSKLTIKLTNKAGVPLSYTNAYFFLRMHCHDIYK